MIAAQLPSQLSRDPLAGLAIVMLLSAAMMADVIAVPLPASIQQRAASIGTGGRARGAFAMGAEVTERRGRLTLDRRPRTDVIAAIMIFE